MFDIGTYRSEFCDILTQAINDADVVINADLVDDRITKGVAFSISGLNREQILAGEGLESISFNVVAIAKSRADSDALCSKILTEIGSIRTEHIKKVFAGSISDNEFNPLEDIFFSTNISLTAYIKR